MTRNLIVVR